MSDSRNAPRVDLLRSPLGRARGLGSARSGSHHWWVQRLTAVALIPLTIWFIFSAIKLTGATRAGVDAWLSSPFTAAMMLGLVIATFHHLQLGLQVVIEDYVHDEKVKVPAVLVMKGVCWLLAAACVVSVLKLAF